MNLMQLRIQESGNVAPYDVTITNDSQFLDLLKSGTTIRGSMMAWLCMLFAVMRAQVSVNVDILFNSNEFILTVIQDASRPIK
mgnify:CR=1 FL=1